MATNELVLADMLMTDGYVGAMGKTWETPTDDDLEAAIIGAMQLNNMSREQVVEALEAGKTLNWCKSPNFHYDHSYGRIGTKRRNVRQDKMIRCSCGHTICASHVMTTSNGTSCPACYDRMSD